MRLSIRISLAIAAVVLLITLAGISCPLSGGSKGSWQVAYDCLGAAEPTIYEIPCGQGEGRACSEDQALQMADQIRNQSCIPPGKVIQRPSNCSDCE